MNSAEIRYATVLLATSDVGRRMPRAQQSEGAARLIDRLSEGDFRPVAESKSHSRALLAAAAGDVPGLRLGIDIEWMAPGRSFGTIARTFLPDVSPQIGMAEFYRGWTFFEAYFKTFGHFPRQELVADVIAHAPDDRVQALGERIWMLQRCVAENFRLCLVWTHATPELCLPVEFSGRPGMRRI